MTRTDQLVDRKTQPIVGGACVLIGVALETTADLQLQRFRRDPLSHGKVLDRGLWRYSRHPNYFGELGFWWGLYLFSVAADTTGAAVERSAIGPLVITSLLVFYSAPALDRRLAARGPAYRDYMRRVPSLLPRTPRVPR